MAPLPGKERSAFGLMVVSSLKILSSVVLDDIVSIPLGNENDHFNAESGLIESLLNRDTLITSPKIDFFLEEFIEENSHLINPIPTRVNG
ncbi:hypothetical protein Tco_0344215 [Tanacetum coccineum]